MTSNKIIALELTAFRGMPGTLALDLRSPSTRKAASLLLVGDNASGKSTIVDALEFSLQARVGRHRSLTSRDVSSLISFSVDALPLTRVTLASGEVVERRVVVTEGIPLIEPRTAHPNFAFAAFVFRRADILRFYDTAEENRQLMFLDYLGGRRGDWAGSMEERQQLLKTRRAELMQAIQKQVHEFCALMKWRPIENLLDEQAFDALLRKRLNRGLSLEQGQRKGFQVELQSMVQKRIDAIRSSLREYRATTHALRGAGRPGVDFKKSMDTLRKVLGNASEVLTSSFTKISALDFIDKLQIAAPPGKEFSLRVIVHLKNGRTCSPMQVFSEANRDLLALLVFLAVLEEAARNNQTPCLILDDVLQSVDASVRVAVTEYLVQRLADWQLVITAHDRLWQAQLRSILQRHGHDFIEREIIRWTFDGGPVLSLARSEDGALLKETLEGGDAIAICSLAGLLHEGIADRLSWVLPVAITRREGDRYTLGDLWPPVVKTLRKTTAAVVADTADRWVHLRNIAGAHFNEWARTLSLGEAREYGAAILALLEKVHCVNCQRFIERVSTAAKWECRCGRTALS